MAWCPECKEEYEDDVEMCGECKVPLVSSLKEVSAERMLLAVNTLEEAEKGLEYLDYSSIKTAAMKEAKNDQDEPVFVIYVNEKELDNASKIMKAYVMAEKEEPNLEDYYFDEYTTIDVEGEAELADIKSSYVAFIGLGGIMAVVGILNVLGLMSFLSGNLPIVFSVVGIVFALIGIYTKASMEAKANNFNKTKESFDSLYTWYINKYPIDKFYKRHEIDVTGLDEGAKYFALMDLIVKECETNDMTDKVEMINTVAEKVFNQL